MGSTSHCSGVMSIDLICSTGAGAAGLGVSAACWHDAGAWRAGTVRAQLCGHLRTGAPKARRPGAMRAQHTCIPSTAKVPQSFEPSIFGSFSVVTCNNKPAPRHHGSRRRRAEGSTEAVAGQMGYGTGDTSGDTKTLEAVWS